MLRVWSSRFQCGRAECRLRADVDSNRSQFANARDADGAAVAGIDRLARGSTVGGARDDGQQQLAIRRSSLVPVTQQQGGSRLNGAYQTSSDRPFRGKDD